MMQSAAPAAGLTLSSPELWRTIVKRSLLAALAAFAWSPWLVAQNCDGDPGFEIHGPDTAPIGTTIDVDLVGPPGALGLLMVSLGQGPVDTPLGTICLDFPLVTAIVFVLDGNGDQRISGFHPCDPAIVDITVYLQFITARPDSGISNQHAITFEDAICDDSFCGFTQGGWGSTCTRNNPGCLRDEFFDTVFPNGVILGDSDGVDADSDFAIIFTSSAAVEAFLPAGGKPDLLDQDAVDPTTTAAGVFAGQLLAAKLNVGFDDAGFLDSCKERDELLLGDLVFADCVDDDLIGMSVRDLIDHADKVISGALGSGPFDIDGDGDDDVTISDISDALTKFNENFENGGNAGCLAIP